MADYELGFRAGDEASLRALYDSYGSLIFTYCGRSVGKDLAADVTQEVFLSAWRSRRNFDPTRGPFVAWLMTIAKRRCIDSIRKSSRQPVTTGAHSLDSEYPTESTEIQRIERIADRMLLDDAFANISNRARQAIELSFFEQLTHTEIAEKTGVPLGTVKSDIRRGLATLRHQLQATDETYLDHRRATGGGQ